MADEKLTEEARTEPKEPRQVSRRRFLFGSGLAVGGAVAAGIAGPVLGPATPAKASDALASPATGEAVPALQKAMGYVSYDPTNCAGCRSCMAVCSLYHEGVVNPELSRIQVVAPALKIFEAKGITCKQCDYPECLYACPTGALHVDAATGARVIDAEKCIGCQSCAKACPQYPDSPILFNSETNKGSKCDLCGGDPQCVKFCPKSVSLTPHLYAEEDRVLKFAKNTSA